MPCTIPHEWLIRWVGQQECSYEEPLTLLETVLHFILNGLITVTTHPPNPTDPTPSVTTMSNSGPYPVTPVASQLYSSTPVAHHLLRSWSRRYTSVKYDPWPSPYSVLTTPHRLPCLDVSSPCTCYIHHLVSFSPDLFYFTWA